jgi:hypothetical protein
LTVPFFLKGLKKGSGKKSGIKKGQARKAARKDFPHAIQPFFLFYAMI